MADDYREPVSTGLAPAAALPYAEFGDRAISLEPGVGGRTMVLNFGPQHPATHGTLRVVLELDGEIVRRCDPEIGFLHTGFEKLGEFRTLNQFITVTDRMNYMSAMNNNVGFAIACEEMLELEIPERAQLIRVIMCELGRIADHILCVGLQAMDLGAFSVMLWSFIEREKLYDIFEMTSGGRLTTSYGRVGGLAFDLPDDVVPRIRDFLEKVPAVIDEIEKMLIGNRIFRDRTIGVGVLPREAAISHGVTGPMLRATGVARDLRRDRPYSGYETFDFEVPVRNDGDCFARFEIRLAEMREAVSISLQAIERLRPGPFNALDHKVTLPDKDDVYTKMESLIHHFMLTMPGHGPEVPKGEFYSATESPNGELGWLIVSDGTAIPYRVRVRPPSYYNYSSIAVMVEGGLISDLVAVLSSLNIIAGELDR